MSSIIDKKHAHELIERLEPSQISTAIQFLEFMLLNPVAHALITAPADDEPVTADDRRRFHDGQAWLQEHGGKGIPMEEVLSEFGLTLDDFPLKNDR